jgi:tetrahydromethanopterin S-methyltransferase subunit G
MIFLPPHGFFVEKKVMGAKITVFSNEDFNRLMERLDKIESNMQRLQE